MKKIFFLVLVFSCLIVFLSCNKSSDVQLSAKIVEQQAAIKFDNDILDFHDLNDGEIVAGSFNFTNVGSHDLVISDVSSSCGCTVADYPKNAIKPGEKGQITVKYDSKGSRGMRVQKKITVLSNTNPSTTFLTIIANVK